MLEIRERLVSAKRHTEGYVLTNGRQLTRLQTVKLARQGKLDGVRVVNGANGPYLMTTQGNIGLYTLPTRIVSRNWRYTKRS